MLLALRNIKKVGAVVDRPKALGDIRGVSYIYGIFYRFGLIDVPDTARQKMKLSLIHIYGGNTFAFFTRNPRGGKAKDIDPQDVQAFGQLAEENHFGKLVAHAPYT